MSTTWFTSDLHLSHTKASELRGFVYPEEHDAAVLAAWDMVVGYNDIVWVLGDFTMGSLPRALARLRLSPGRKRLVLGNHDEGHPMHRDAHKADYSDAFEYVSTSARVRLQGKEVLLSHFPYERDRLVARHMQWRLPDLGVPLLHGHTHGQERRTTTPLGTPELHVGVDAWDLRPVASYELAELL